MKLDIETLLGWLKEKYPYDMLQWVKENYWVSTEVRGLSEKEVEVISKST